MAKKALSFLLFLLLLLMYAPLTHAAPPPPAIVGETAILMDMKTGQVIYEKDADRPMEPASTTKILTAIVALEKGHLDDWVTASERVPLTEGTRIYMEAGESIRLEDLLYAMMLNSANDAAVAIAEHLAGTVAEFAKLMNEKAQEIGAKNSHFVTPNGLSAKGHYTTARDLALIARYAMQNPKFREIVAAKERPLPREEKRDGVKHLYNQNELLWRYAGATGVKTGYTSTAQMTIVASAERDGRELLAVVLKSQGKNIWTDAANLLDYGFTTTRLVPVVAHNENVGEIKTKYGDPVGAVTGKDFFYVVPVENPPQIKKEIKLLPLKAPVNRGDPAGEMIIKAGEQVIAKIPLYTANAAKRKIYTYWWVWVIGLYVPYRILIAILRLRRRHRRFRHRRSGYRGQYVNLYRGRSRY